MSQYGAFERADDQEPKMRSFKSTVALVGLVGLAAVVGTVGVMSVGGANVKSTVNGDFLVMDFDKVGSCDCSGSANKCYSDGDEIGDACNCGRGTSTFELGYDPDDPAKVRELGYSYIMVDGLKKCFPNKHNPSITPIDSDIYEALEFCPYEMDGTTSSCNFGYNSCDDVATLVLGMKPNLSNSQRLATVLETATTCIMSGPVCHFDASGQLATTLQAECTSCLQRFAPKESNIGCDANPRQGRANCTTWGGVFTGTQSSVTDTCSCEEFYELRSDPMDADSKITCNDAGTYDAVAGGVCQQAYSASCYRGVNLAATQCNMDFHGAMDELGNYLSDCDQLIDDYTGFSQTAFPDPIA